VSSSVKPEMPTEDEDAAAELSDEEDGEIDLTPPTRAPPPLPTQSRQSKAGEYAPPPKPVRQPPLVSDVPQVSKTSQNGATQMLPPSPAPRRAPPRVADAKASAIADGKPQVAVDVPPEAMSGWSYWTTEEVPLAKLPLTPAVPPVPSRRPPPKVAETPSAQEERLPGDWRKHVDVETHFIYYYSLAIQTSQWDRPDTRSQGDSVKDLKLPPGWKRKWSSTEASWYFIDVELQRSQWRPPEAHAEHEWHRKVDQSGRALWVCSDTDFGNAFYESDAAWARFVDSENRAYWSNADKGIRFFEP
jgi:hypothetical protein